MKSALFSRKTAVKEVTLDDGTKVYVRKLSQAAAKQLPSFNQSEEAKAEFIAFIVVECLCDADGAHDDELDIETVSAQPFDDIQHIAVEALEFSGIAAEKKALPKSEEQS